MSKIIDEIMDMPDAFSLHSELTQKLQEEKERRQKFYKEVDESTKAEFIKGEIVLHSPAKRWHIKASLKLTLKLGDFVEKNDLGEVYVEKAMISLTRNDYEPDICFFRKSTSKDFKPEQSHFPAPDFIVEILSDSTEKRDRGIKFTDYQQHGVDEYWIVDPENKSLEQYILKNGEYYLNLKSDHGLVKCKVLEGLEFEIEEIFQ